MWGLGCVGLRARVYRVRGLGLRDLGFRGRV